MSVQENQIENQSLDMLVLLREWYEWWQGCNEVPHKMPNALHVRTAIATNDFERTKFLQDNCAHEYWNFENGGTTTCRACGADTSDMDGMGL